MRLGLFGGTFDPIHIGHLIIADWVRQLLALDKVIFIPAGDPPHKDISKITPAHHRLTMVQLSVRDDPHFECDDYEVKKKGKSYTVETLQWYRSKYSPDTELNWIIGSDSLIDMRNWFQPDRILELSRVVVYPRPGFPVERADERFRSRAILLNTPQFDFSSTIIREKIASGFSVRYLLYPAVAEYIEKHGIYSRQ